MSRFAPFGRFALGAAIALSLPPYGLWALAPIGIGVFLKTSRTASHGRRLFDAWSLWMGYFTISLAWMIDLTVPGWIVATPVQALIMALPMALIPASGAGRAFSVPSALVVGEAIRWVVPFGGVPMSNLALGPIDTYLADVVRVGGALLLVASIGILAVGVEAALSVRLRTVVGVLAATVLLIVIARVSPRGHPDTVINASVVQAGGALGTRAATSDQLAVFDRHREAVARQSADTDLMVWSESSVTVERPLETSDQLATIAQLATELDAVIIANFSEIDGDRFRNASVSIDPDTGFVSRFDKVHLVPFGEYIPLRGLVDNFADLSLISREAIAGEGPGILNSRLGPIGNAISFEVYFPDRVRSGMRSGARILTNPTLASSYTTSLVPEQSLASARLRAIETGRWVLQASTTGYSAVVSAGGEVVLRSDLREQTVLTTSVELRSGNTWATDLGKLPISLIAVGLLAGNTLSQIRRRSSR